MTYTFESRATNSIVMLHSPGRRVLEILQQDAGAASGVIIHQRIPAAIAALQKAVADEQGPARKPSEIDLASQPAPPHGNDGVSLRQRVAPLVQMLERSMVEESDITWHD